MRPHFSLGNLKVKGVVPCPLVISIWKPISYPWTSSVYINSELFHQNRTIMHSTTSINDVAKGNLPGIMPVVINDPFWSSRMKVVAENTLPSMYNVLKETGRWDFFDFNWKQMKDIKPHIFWDSDIAKFLEAVCYTLRYTEKSDAKYSLYTGWIDLITKMAKKAQQDDGYLNSYYTQIKPKERFSNIGEDHELYCCGHLIEAAVSHYEATGSMELVEVLCKYVDYLFTVFGPDENQLHGYPGHQEIELALVKLYRIVPKKEYLALLNYFVEQRGYNDTEFYDQQIKARGFDPATYKPLAEYDHMEGEDPDSTWPTPRSHWYYQAHKPIREMEEVVGHSVRVVYHLTGVQGLAMLKKDDSLKAAVKKLFDNMIDKKFYIHGGIGAIAQWEGFGEDYDLRWDCYSETCALIGLMFLCERMLADKLDRKVALAMERALYNDVLGGVNIDGDAYYYNQPISGEKGYTRQKWFSCACCPPNVARLFSSLEKYSLLVKDDMIAVHLYIGAEINTSDVQMKVSSKYPNEGEVVISLKTSKPISIAIREPLGEYAIDTLDFEVSNGYILLPEKVWKDTITLRFDVPVEIVKPDPHVKANAGHLAIQRGPFIYGLQSSGISGDTNLDDIKISSQQMFKQSQESFHDADYISLTSDMDGTQLKFVPYFVTGNEHPGEDFRLWIKEM